MAEKKRGGGRMLLLAVVAGALVFLGTLLGECGLGTGLGPGLKGLTPGAGTAASATPTASVTATATPTATASAAPSSCRLRLDRDGLTLDGKPTGIADVIESCKRAGKAELVTTGDAVYGDHEKLRKALHEAGVFVLERSP